MAPAILQPAEPFLDLSGEDIRKRMYLTTDAEGRELCLRPDLTIPVSRDYLASPASRQRRRASAISARSSATAAWLPAEFLQAGIESFGRPDKAAADAEMLALGLEATAHYGIAAPEIRMGDVGLFSALVAALDLAPAWKRRLVKDFNRKTSLAHDLDVLTLTAPERAGISGRAGGARGLRSEGRARAGHRPALDRRHHRRRRPHGRRDRRPLPRAGRARRRRHAAARDARADRAIPSRHRRSRRGGRGAARARGRCRHRARPALDLFESRTGFLAARGVDVARISFSTAFGRGLDYYTGFVFELHDAGPAPNGPLVAGGRYDELLTRLGAKRRFPRSALRSGSSGLPPRRRRMSAPLVIAVPSKGRLQENAEAFFARAGLRW